MKIGVFDSGLGGLLILRAITQLLPEYDYYYYGDTKHVPYGDRSENEIYELTKTAIEFLFAQDCWLVIIACNTSSAETLRRLQDEYLPQTHKDRRILGVIIPTIETLSEVASEKALLLATKRTVESNKYQLELSLKRGNTELCAIACPELVPLIEQGDLSQAIEVAKNYIHTWEGKGDAVILGCTHYGLMKTELRQLYPDLQFISQDEVVPKKLKLYLSNHPELETRLSRKGDRQIHLTEHRSDYDDLMVSFLQGR